MNRLILRSCRWQHRGWHGQAAAWPWRTLSMQADFSNRNHRGAVSFLNVSTVLLIVLATLLPAAHTLADDASKLESLSAYDAVREGNRLLEQGNAEGALQAYNHAGKLAPDALEVPFVKGVGNYDLKRFDDARQAFEKAVLSKDRKLATDAQYGIGAAHHAEALALLNNPPAAPDAGDPAASQQKEALQHLESAMQSYRGALANNPNHAAAREANSKAAHLWKKVKQEIQQQQQQQQQKQDSENKDENNEDQQQQQENQNDDQKNENKDSQEQQENQDSEQKQQESQENQSDEQKKENAQEQKSEEQQQKESAEQSEEKKQEEQTAAQQKEQRESQEQANRKLREMMQTVRDRQKNRREKIERVPVRPVEKDW